MKKRQITEKEYIKAARKGSREAEIGLYGRPLTHQRVHRSKKTYNRKIAKAALKKLPFFVGSAEETVRGYRKDLLLLRRMNREGRPFVLSGAGDFFAGSPSGVRILKRAEISL